MENKPALNSDDLSSLTLALVLALALAAGHGVKPPHLTVGIVDANLMCVMSLTKSLSLAHSPPVDRLRYCS